MVLVNIMFMMEFPVNCIMLVASEPIKKYDVSNIGPDLLKMDLLELSTDWSLKNNLLCKLVM